MKYLDLTLPTPEENLACDEALMDVSEGGGTEEVLRFWEPREHFVVAGYSNKIRSEVYLDFCRAAKIPVLRRCTGGGTILQGPGCLNYSLVLRLDRASELRSITNTNRYILDRHQRALEPLAGSGIRVTGTTDLALGALKFSGNAQRRKKHSLLFHGTFLFDFDIPLISRCLAMPSKQPAYRRTRPHEEFLTNLGLPGAALKQALRKAWGAAQTMKKIPVERIAALVREKYSKDEWNFKF